MAVQLSEHLTTKKIFRSVIGPIAMMVFSSVYAVVDGLFISGNVGSDAFAGINLVWPLIMVFSSLGMMLGSGGSALVSKLMGEKRQEEANQTFSFIIYVCIGIGFISAAAAYFVVEPFARWMASLSSGNTETMIDFGIRYGRILCLGLPISMLQMAFHSFFSTAERPYTGFAFVLAAGLTNIALDALFIGVFRWQVEGAAAATLIGYVIGGFCPLLYFFFYRKAPLRLGKTHWNGFALWKSTTNGCSEFISNISGSIVSMCYNAQLLRYVGPAGVSSYGIIMYVSYVFMAIFMGYSIGIAPFVGYNYGAQNHEELHNIFKRSLIIIAIFGVSMFGLSEAFGPLLGSALAGGSAQVVELSKQAIHIYSFVFLTAGFSIYGSSFFTALNNGLISGIISIVRSIVFELAAVFLLPLMWQVNGIWAAAPFAEIGSTIMTVFFYIKEKKRYMY